MLALDNNNELYRSHVEIKRRVVELCIQAVLSDMKDSNANPPEVMALAEDVMQWAYDLIGMLFVHSVSRQSVISNLALTEGRS